MRTILEVYFGINLFVSGCYFNNKWSWSRSSASSIKAIVFSILLTPSAILVGLSIVVWYLLYQLNEWADKYLQHNIFFSYYFTRQYCNLPPEMLERINAMAATHTTNSRNDRIWRKYIAKINKRNNFTPHKN